MRMRRVNDSPRLSEGEGLGIELWAFKQRGRPDGAVHNTDERQVSIEALVVEAISNDKDGVYREADVIDLNIHLAVGGLVQKCAYFDRGGGLSENLIDKQFEGDAGVHDVLDDEDIPAPQALTERVGHFNGVAAFVNEAVNVDKLHGRGDVHFPHKVRQETDDAVQRANADDLAVGVLGAQLPGQCFHAALEACLADKDAIDALGGGAGKAIVPPRFRCAG